MCNNSRLLRVCALASAAFTAGCDGLSLPDDTADSASTFLGLVVSDFSGTNAISVQNGAVTSGSASASWPQDLLADAPDDAVIIVSGTELSVTFEDESVLLNSSTEPTEHHARVTFRFGAAGTNPCASEVFIGPFDVVIVDGETALDTDSLPFTGDVRNIVNAGGFEVCAQADADFDGLVSAGKVKVEFGALKQGESKVELCHVPPGDPDAQHTITIGESAVEAHMAHGDELGACTADGESPDDPAPLDTDGDGVLDEADSCADTLTGAPVDSSGCSCAQKDGDGDGVNDCNDACPDSTESIVGADGCGLDADGDGVNDTADTCADTPTGELADSRGCSCSQLDVDADGVNDCND
ncbi:MAG: thrombospondin type 3 repeat-containing protein, partial [Planctomycetes bacterium]|nr:thrombospondin type 3 repeat-containing protein [Planctomycetota bacterium]